jgi:archaellum component FlaC
VRKIETELSLSGEKEFNDAMKAVNNNLKTQSAELAEVSSRYDENASASEKLKAKGSILAEQVDQQKEKVRALNEMYKKSVDAKGEDSAAADKYKQQLLQAQSALNKMEKALDDNTKAYNKAKQPLNQLAEAIDKTRKKIEDFKDKHEALYKAMERFSSVASKASSGIKAFGEAGASAVKGITSLTAVGVAAAGALATLATTGIKKLADYAVEAADNGDPAFAGLEKNLTALSTASTAAKAALGSVLLPTLESLSADGAQWLNDFSEAMAATNGDTEAMGEVMSSAITSGVAIIRNKLPEFLKLGKELLSGLGTGIIENLPELADDVEGIINELLDGLEDNADDLGDAAATIVMTLGDMIITNAPNLLTAGLQMLTSLVMGLVESSPEELGQKAVDLVTELLQALVTNAPMLLVAGAELILGIIQGIIESIPDLVAKAPEMIDEFKQGLTDASKNLVAAGHTIVSNIWQGIVEKWESVKTWFKNAVSALGTAGDAGTAVGLPYATGLDYVPYDDMPARLHEGEMVVPKRLASQLRSLGINKNSDLNNLSFGGNTVNTTINTMTLSQSQIDYLVELINKILGGMT